MSSGSGNARVPSQKEPLMLARDCDPFCSIAMMPSQWQMATFSRERERERDKAIILLFILPYTISIAVLSCTLWHHVLLGCRRSVGRGAAATRARIWSARGAARPECLDGLSSRNVLQSLLPRDEQYYGIGRSDC